jgi:hypothetical protein
MLSVVCFQQAHTSDTSSSKPPAAAAGRHSRHQQQHMPKSNTRPFVQVGPSPCFLQVHGTSARLLSYTSALRTVAASNVTLVCDMDPAPGSAPPCTLDSIQSSEQEQGGRGVGVQGQRALDWGMHVM